MNVHAPSLQFDFSKSLAFESNVFMPIDISKMVEEDGQRPQIEEALVLLDLSINNTRKQISKFRMNQKLLTKVLNNQITETNKNSLNQVAQDFIRQGAKAYDSYTNNIKIAFDRFENILSSIINEKYRLKCQREFDKLIKVANLLINEVKDTILMLKILERKTSSEKRVRNLIYTPEQLSHFMNS